MTPSVGDLQVIADLAFAQRLNRQAHVAGIVLDQEDFDGTAFNWHAA